MIGVAKTLLGLVVMAGGVGFWVWTPWWLWGTALVMAGLGVMKFSGVVSTISLAGAVGLLALGYAVQPEGLVLLETLLDSILESTGSEADPTPR